MSYGYHMLISLIHSFSVLIRKYLLLSTRIPDADSVGAVRAALAVT